MYTKMELTKAERAITEIAKENGVTEEHVREAMTEAIEAARSDPSPSVQAQWRDFEFAGPEPTPEEFIAWMTRKINRAMMEHELYEISTLGTAYPSIPS